MKLLDNCCLTLLLITTNLWGKDNLQASTAVAQNNVANQSCPQKLVDLGNLLTEDISDYGNRVIQRSSIYSHKLNFLPTYIITASKAETEPLLLNQFAPSANQNYAQIQQIFLTTLERQYSDRQMVIETENYHWLIMTHTTEGWKLVTSFTRFGYPRGDDFITSAPRDTTNGIIGQAVKLWLKDCQAGSLR